MTGQRRGYVIALVVAVTALVLSVGMAVTGVATGHLSRSWQMATPVGRAGVARRWAAVAWAAG